MIRHLVRMSAAIALLAACMLLPFLPGGYDGLAVTLSTMSQLFGMVGLLLVPLGLIWFTYELKRRSAAPAGPGPGKDWAYRFALASIAASTFVTVVVSLGALVTAGLLFGIVSIAFWAYCVVRLTRKLKAIRSTVIRPFNAAPLYLIVLPIIAASLRIALVGSASELSRNRAIENSAPLIHDIERYREVHGSYPRSLLSVWQDYKPGVIGVEQYHYEPNGEAYNLFFEHWSDQLGTREFVMYNPRDEHQMTSHDMDLLQRTPTELAWRRGYYAVHDAASPHWKRFLFD